MWKLIWFLVFSATANLFSAGQGSAETLRMIRPASLDPATRAFVETFEKSPLLSEAGIEIQSFPDGAIVAPNQAVDALQKKIVDLALVPYFAIAPKPSNGFAVSLLGNPTMVTDAREQFAIQDSRYGDRIAAELGRQQLISLAYWNRSPWALLLKKPVTAWEDIKGQKVVAFDLNSRNLIAALGAVPTQVPAGDIFAAMERGVVDAAEIGPSTPIVDKQTLDAYRGGTVVSNFRQHLGFLAAHQDTWLKVTERQRQALAKAAKNSESAARRVVYSEQERFPSVVRESQIQFVAFSQLGRAPADNDAQAVWLKQAGDGGRSAIDLLQKVKLELALPRQPQRGGALPAAPTAKILFATIRNDEKASDLAERFGLKRQDNPTLSCGAVTFALPANRKIGESYEGQISVQQGTSVATNNDCHSMIGAAAEKAGGNLAIFVHGFNNSMVFAVQRAIGFATDLELSTPVIVWSWPSANRVGMYDYDEDSVNWSRIHFQSFVRTLLSDERIKRITLVSHSMGGRLVCMALEAAHGHTRKSVISDAIFAAPDVIVPEFRQTARLFGSAADRISLYATSTDRALLHSVGIHRDDLAGLGGDKVLVLPNVETVDASEVETFLSWNHSYAFDVEEVLKDLKKLLSGNLAAANRGLKKVPKSNHFYWLIPKAQ
jgi:esterase/lipase superfamily enzyme/TRAP-type mannitol/chloroaromatic compound transport system substrate-binding protein